MPRVPYSARMLKAHILLVLMTFIWGSTFVLIKAALASISPLLFNAIRMTLAAIIVAILYRKQLGRLTPQAALAGVIVGVFLFLGYELQTTGLQRTTPSKSAFLTGVSTVLVPLFLILFWRARTHLWRALGITCAFIGLFLMTVPAGREAMADFAKINAGDLLSLGCAVAFAFQIIFLGRATRHFPFEQIAVLQLSVAAVFMLMAAPVMEHPRLQLTPTVVWAILITGVLCTAVAFTVQAWAQQFTPASHAALIFTLEPVFAWLTSLVYLGERLGGRAGAGALLIVAGVLLSEVLDAGRTVEPEEAGDRDNESSCIRV